MRIGRYTIRVFFAAFDFWIGVYVDLKNTRVFIAPAPCLIICITRLTLVKDLVGPVEAESPVGNWGAG